MHKLGRGKVYVCFSGGENKALDALIEIFSNTILGILQIEYFPVVRFFFCIFKTQEIEY